MPSGVYPRKLGVYPRKHLVPKAEREAQNLCVGCARPRNGGSKTLCVACLKLNKDRVERLLADGLCRACGANKICEGRSKSRCRGCLDKINNRVKKLQADGLCGCGKREKLPTHKQCEECYLKVVAGTCLKDRSRWQEIREIFFEQGGICAITGESMAFGDQISIDHIVPVSRGGTHQRSNIHWCRWVANKAKNNLTMDEFVAMCRRVVAHHSKASDSEE